MTKPNRVWQSSWIFAAAALCLHCAPPHRATVPSQDTTGRPAGPSANRAGARGTIVAPGASADRLTAALLTRLTVWTRRDGTRVLTRYCRSSTVPCETRVDAFAGFFFRAARSHGIDPLLLAAIALRESNLDPSAVGPLGTAGIMQLHPRGVGRGEPFVEDAAYREQCLQRVDACQWDVIDRASAALAEAVRACGNLDAALGRYASGRCQETPRYSRKVKEEWRRLAGMVSEPPSE